MTYSIVARDERTGRLGVACQSHFFAPGASVTWAEPGVGVVATQAFVDGRYGRRGLESLGEGAGARETLDALRAADPHPEVRQVALVGTEGDAVAWTGERCIRSAGALVDGSVSVQGNMLADDGVLPAMLEAYRGAEGDLADRILAAMAAAEAAGGDVRGSQGASLAIVEGTAGDDPWNRRPIDLRVEDHRDPVGELRRLVRYRRAFDVVSGTMFAPGLMVGPYAEPEPGATDRALDALAEAAEVMAGNPEADVWAGVLQARAGRIDDARETLGRALDLNPRVGEFVARLVPAGILTPAELAQLGVR